MGFLRRQTGQEIAAGAVFERPRANNVTERVTVVSIAKDHAGIPHVRFRISFSGYDDVFETRTLALTEFKQQYSALRSNTH
jgi:hypothetical protein